MKGGELYAVSTQGQVTGFGAGHVDEEDNLTEEDYQGLTFDSTLNILNGAILIDDTVKPEDAESDVVRERINQRFENTIRNRTNSRNTPIIIIMQRLHEHDLCGYLDEIEPGEWTTLSLPAIQVDEEGNESALWPMKHTLEELHKMRAINPLVFDTQYMQDPKPKEGLMYPEFKTYVPEQLPTGRDAYKRWNYTDTADEGDDYLCSIDYQMYNNEYYILDIIFTQEPMEVTEPAVAEMLTKDNVGNANIESNNGGRGFARNVITNLRKLGNRHTNVRWFHQGENKVARILSNSTGVMNNIFFPLNWEDKWPEFAIHLKHYVRTGKNEHDVAEDCLTGVYENPKPKYTNMAMTNKSFIKM